MSTLVAVANNRELKDMEAAAVEDLAIATAELSEIRSEMERRGLLQ